LCIGITSDLTAGIANASGTSFTTHIGPSVTMAACQTKKLPQFQFKILIHDILRILYKKFGTQDKPMDENVRKHCKEMM
jgi:hypothetical protein